MREYVRWWITAWDLRRLYPTYEPDIEVGQLAPDYSEDAALETPGEAEGEWASRPDQSGRPAGW